MRHFCLSFSRVLLSLFWLDWLDFGSQKTSYDQYLSYFKDQAEIDQLNAWLTP